MPDADRLHAAAFALGVIYTPAIAFVLVNWKKVFAMIIPEFQAVIDKVKALTAQVQSGEASVAQAAADRAAAAQNVADTLAAVSDAVTGLDAVVNPPAVQ